MRRELPLGICACVWSAKRSRKGPRKSASRRRQDEMHPQVNGFHSKDEMTNMSEHCFSFGGVGGGGVTQSVGSGWLPAE